MKKINTLLLVVGIMMLTGCSSIKLTCKTDYKDNFGNSVKEENVISYKSDKETIQSITTTSTIEISEDSAKEYGVEFDDFIESVYESYSKDVESYNNTDGYTASIEKNDNQIIMTVTTKNTTTISYDYETAKVELSNEYTCE